MIYLIRHGQTDANVNDVWQGQSGNGSLNDNGRQQAEKLAIYLSDKGINKIYSSDLLRAKETAGIVAEKLDLSTHEESLLREMSYGELEGIDTDEVDDEYGELHERWLKFPETTVFPDGESFRDLMERAKQVVKKYFYADENVVMLSHGDMIRAVIVAVSGKPSEFHFPHITNTCITTFVNNDGKIIIKDIADTPHLQ